MMTPERAVHAPEYLNHRRLLCTLTGHTFNMLGEICTVMFFAPLKCLETEDREGIKCANTGLKQPHFPRCVAVKFQGNPPVLSPRFYRTNCVSSYVSLPGSDGGSVDGSFRRLKPKKPFGVWLRHNEAQKTPRELLFE